MNSRPIIKGDKVSHYINGVGVVDALDTKTALPFGFTYTMCRVKWESGAVTWEAEFVLHLIPTQPTGQ